MQAPVARPAQAVSSPTAVPGGKNPATAFNAAVLGTAAGFGMVVVGARTDSSTLGLTGLALTVVGPSFGHFYAGETGSGLTQIGLRAGSVGAMVGGTIWLLAECLTFFDEEECSPGPGPALLIAGGLAVGTGSTLYSIFDAPRAARRQNARAPRLVLAPAPVIGPDHSSGFGLQLGGQF
ncbi:MAG TPA: hypothetical protein VNM90_11315 [Haliangium sp.]|nr:hypothetical protein [Haliangium sp.]